MASVVPPSLNTTSEATPLQQLTIPALDNTFGAYLIGSIVGLGLYGIFLHQVFIYYNHYTKDVAILKVMVAAVVILETFSATLNMHACYYYLVTSYFKPTNLQRPVWSLCLSTVILVLTDIVAQSFFVRRLFLVGGYWRPISIAVALMMIIKFAFATAATTVSFLMGDFSHIDKIAWLVAVSSIITTIGDVMLTVGLFLALRNMRTGIRNTDSMVQVITLYAINTGLVNW
ncbi:hypothetical protein C8Q80DRAFT_766907 [Daedaleopsis nitida]|nr:hypothetical protein C8Q80DRAFT_766907 [Daedaleopsis nitida]